MATHFFACSYPKTWANVAFSQPHTVCRVKLSFGTRALMIKVPYMLATCLLSCDIYIGCLDIWIHHFRGHDSVASMTEPHATTWCLCIEALYCEGTCVTVASGHHLHTWPEIKYALIKLYYFTPHSTDLRPT